MSGLHLDLWSPSRGPKWQGLLTSWAMSLTKCARSSVWRNCGPHPTTHKLMGWWRTLYQTIMRMIEKLGKDKKADWPGHLAEIVHAYNATCSAMTEYSPHYLMFEQRPRLHIDFYFPPLEVLRLPQERPLPNMWMNTWLLLEIDWGQPFKRLRSNWQQKLSAKNGTMTKR